MRAAQTLEEPAEAEVNVRDSTLPATSVANKTLCLLNPPAEDPFFVVNVSERIVLLNQEPEFRS